MTPPSPDPEPVAAEPLTAEEERGLRIDFAVGVLMTHANLARLLATLAAARSAPPIAATALTADQLANALSSAGFTPGRFTKSRYAEPQMPLHSRSFTDAATDLLAALPVREDGPTGIDGGDR